MDIKITGSIPDGQVFEREALHPRLKAGYSQLRLILYGPAAGWTVLVLPGGGYHLLAPREGEPVARAFAQVGFGAAVLEYSIAPDRYPQSLVEAAAAVSFLRRQGAERVAVCGFSAGGHLAGALSNLWQGEAIRTLGLAPEEARPDAAILCYPVITARPPHIHPGSFAQLLGEGVPIPPELSLEDAVRPDTPPTFLWTTLTDDTVPAENTRLYANALRRAGVSFELHLYPQGPHAMALADARTPGWPEQQDPHVASWFPLCTEWLKGL